MKHLLSSAILAATLVVSDASAEVQRWHWSDGTVEVVATLWKTSVTHQPPLILLCPGRGTKASAYGSIATHLANEGFAVLGVDIPRIGHVIFPDGREISPSAEYRPSFELITGPYAEVDRFFEPAVRQGLDALELALDRFSTTLEGADVDMTSMGALGHSLGGRICGAHAGRDDRIQAYVTFEGVPPPEVRRGGLSASSLQLYTGDLPEDLALPNIRELFDSSSGPSTLLRLEGFGHNSITDGPRDNPDAYEYDVHPDAALETLETLLAGFLRTALEGNDAFIPAEDARIVVKAMRHAMPGAP